MGREVAGRYVVDVPVRWSDMDVFGHVNNARTLTLLEEARVDWLFVGAAERGTEALTRGVVVTRVRIDYRRPIAGSGTVAVSMGVTRLGHASVTLDYVVHQEEQLVVTAETVLAPIDPATGAPRRFTADERAFLDRYRSEPT